MRKYKGLLTILLLLCIILTTFSFCSYATSNASDKPMVRMGFIALKDNAEQNEDGSFSGINVEYAYKIAQYANINIEIVLFQTGQEALTMLDEGKIDMMCNVLKTPDRKEKYLFSENEVGNVPMCVFVRKNNDLYSFGNTNQLVNMTFGAEANSKVKDLFTGFCTDYGITPTIVTYANIKDVKNAIDTSQIDAGLYGAASVNGYRSILNFSPLPYYFVFRKDDHLLKTKIDEAMGSILSEDSLYYGRLVQKYMTPDSTMETLTRREKAYIADHPKITVAVVDNNEPYYSASTQPQPKGIIPDFYDKLAHLTGLSFSYKIFRTQEAAIHAVINGDADVLGIYSEGQIRSYGAGLRITRPYASVDTVLITKTGKTVEQIKRIAVKKSNPPLRSNVAPKLMAESVVYNNTKECFQALKDGRVDAIVCEMPVATWLINQQQAAAYSITTLEAFTMELCGATTYENNTLCSILSKAINASSYSFNEIVTANTLPENRWETLLARIPVFWIIAVAIVLLALVIGLAVTLLTLRRKQHEKDAIYAAKRDNERRNAEITILAKNAEARNTFFSTISHDMRTPLNAILGFTKMARNKDLPAETRNAYLEKVETSGNLLLDLINDTLTISKVNSGKLELRAEPVEITELFESIIVSVQHDAECKHISLISNCAKIHDHMVLADKLNVQKIFLNLLSNAIKYTPQGGHIWFTLSNEPGPNNMLDTLLIVKDDGIGISKEFLPHIFDAFAQEKQPGYESVGTGLGLSIVKQLVELMDGTISVQSEKGRGTTFTVRLHFPETTSSKDAAAVKPPVSSIDFHGKRFLLCEDNELNREIACILLQDKGIEVVNAANGSIGLQLFTESAFHEFDGILMDIRMPIMNGYETAKAIRELPRSDAQTIPIIAMTADAFADDIQKCLDSGMNGHIAKPIDSEQMFTVLAALL